MSESSRFIGWGVPGAEEAAEEETARFMRARRPRTGLAALRDYAEQAGGAVGKAGAAVDTVFDPIRKMMGTYVPEQSLPELNSRYTFNDRNYAPFEGMRRSTIPADIPAAVPVYRGDERKGGLETLPLGRFDYRSPLKRDTSYYYGDSPETREPGRSPEINEMYATARIMGAAKALGLPHIPADRWAALVLKEGRPDAGFNTFLPQAEPDLAFRKKLNAYNIPDWQKDMLGMVHYADRISKAKKVPFEAVWNGLGTNALGQTGKDYAKTVAAHRAALADPKNKEFVSFVNRAYADGAKYGLPLMKDRSRDIDSQYKADPHYKYHKPPAYASGGGVAVDDGNPAKRRKLI